MSDQNAATKQKSLGDILQEFSQHRRVMQGELQKVIVGQDEVIEQIFAAIFTRGHCLLEGVPGLAKTLMVSRPTRVWIEDVRMVLNVRDSSPRFGALHSMTPTVHPGLLHGLEDCSDHRMYK